MPTVKGRSQRKWCTTNLHIFLNHIDQRRIMLRKKPLSPMHKEGTEERMNLEAKKCFPSNQLKPMLDCFPCGSAGKEFTCNVGDLGSIPGLGRSPGEGKGYPLQYSGLEKSLDYIVHGGAKSRTRLSDFHFHFHARLAELDVFNYFSHSRNR